MEKDNFKWDRWQQDVLDTNGNITIRSGRQVGKSEVISAKAARFATSNPETITLVIAASQRQSSLLFEKIKNQLIQENIKLEEEPTLTKIILKNGSKIYSLPAGRTGYFIRGFSIDLLIADEAAYIPEVVWNAVIPMIAVSRKLRGMGWIILLSTPFGKGGYFFDSFSDGDFKAFHVSSETCPRIPRDFLAKEKKRMTKAEYAQEYLGEFLDDWNQYFRTDLIKKRMTFLDWSFEREYNSHAKYYLGVDIARFGGDENAFVIGEINKNLRIVKALTTTKMALTDTIGRILELDKSFKFKRIFIDDAGVGGGVMDVLLEKLGRKVVGLNNAKRSINKDGNQKSILKEDLYSNALILMEQAEIDLVNDMALLKSLQSIIYEYTSEKYLKIHGDYSHLAEAFVRVCWSVKDKGLNVFLA